MNNLPVLLLTADLQKIVQTKDSSITLIRVVDPICCDVCIFEQSGRFESRQSSNKKMPTTMSELDEHGVGSLPLASNDFCIWETKTLKMIPLAMSLVIVLFGIVVVLLHRYRQKYLPPLSSSGYFRTMQILSTKHAPWWILSETRQQRHGIVRLNLWIPGTHTILVADPLVARTILQEQPQVKPYLVYSGFNRVLGGWNIVTSNGKCWHRSRKGAAPAFSKINLERMNHMSMNHLDQWIQEQRGRSSTSSVEFDVAQEMVELTTRSIATAALFYSISKPEIETFHQDLETVLIEYLRSQVGNPLRLLFGWFLPEVHKANQAARRLIGLARTALDHYQDIPNMNPTNAANARGSLIQCIADNPNYRSDDERASDILTFLVAGHDTTAYSIAWTLIELARRPDLQDRLRTELKNANHMDSCEFLQCVVQESLRLHPVAAMGAVRNATRRIPIPETDRYIPKGSTVFVHLLSIHRNPSYWDRPDEFWPERWQQDQSPSTTKNGTRQAYFPFALGARNCIGQGLAMKNVLRMVARIIQSMELTVQEVGSVDHFLTLKPVGVRLRATLLENEW
jgi:cytochrome P450